MKSYEVSHAMLNEVVPEITDNHNYFKDLNKLEKESKNDTIIRSFKGGFNNPKW
jgi:hypothetical protein